jgi:uroporphyrinogen decarboxylase
MALELHRKIAPSPDWRNIQSAARNQWAPRLPLYEHGIGQKVIYETTGLQPYAIWYSTDMAESREGFRQFWDFWRQMGYDSAQMEFSICPILPGGGALGQHESGCIKTMEDFQKYPWDELPELYFQRYTPYIRNFTETCPPGMKAVGGVGNGLFEAVQDIVGYMDLCFIKADDEELYEALFKAMGEASYRIWDRFMAEFSDVFCVLRFGDDLGFNTQTLISPEDIRRHIIPPYIRIINRVHKENKPFLLHSCGKIFEVMEDLIGAGIDAKHSNQDVIAHFSEWVERYGDRIGNFGGIDTDVLCRYDRPYIREYILDCLEKVKGRGGIAFSSGNSIPDYVPAEGYLAMIETVREWRGDCGRSQL